jgi:hypothetical protein
LILEALIRLQNHLIFQRCCADAIKGHLVKVVG